MIFRVSSVVNRLAKAFTAGPIIAISLVRSTIGLRTGTGDHRKPFEQHESCHHRKRNTDRSYQSGPPGNPVFPIDLPAEEDQDNNHRKKQLQGPPSLVTPAIESSSKGCFFKGNIKSKPGILTFNLFQFCINHMPCIDRIGSLYFID